MRFNAIPHLHTYILYCTPFSSQWLVLQDILTNGSVERVPIQYIHRSVTLRADLQITLSMLAYYIHNM